MKGFIKILFTTLVGTLIIGTTVGCGGSESSKKDQLNKDKHNHGGAETKGDAKKEVWTCSMHPNVRQPEKGKCPICAMDLIPLTDEDSGDAPILKLSERAIKLAEIETEKVRKGLLARSFLVSGKVVVPETQVRSLTARFPGRVDKVFVKFPGAYVKKGMPLAKIYSPSLITSQQEFLTVLKSTGAKGKFYEAARNRLLLLGITSKQIGSLIKKGKPSAWSTIYSPVEGYVKELSVIEGDYLKKGSRLFLLGDLDYLWAEFDVYGPDLQWIRYGQKIVLTAEDGTGKLIESRISFVQPFFQAGSKVAKIRVDISNRDGSLKPGMFVRGRTGALLDSVGRSFDQELGGNWISPVHPGIISEKPGVCSKSGAPLVKASEYGYVEERSVEKLLLIPETAPLITGKRAVVYVALPSDGKFEGREVVLGQKGDGYYQIMDGVKYGEEVVVNGAFKLDSELQIKAKPSMMSRSGKGSLSGDFLQPEREVFIPESIRGMAELLVNGYFPVQSALGGDDFKGAEKAASKLMEIVESVETHEDSSTMKQYWLKRVHRVKMAVQKFSKAEDIGKARVEFEELTFAIEDIVLKFGSGKSEVYRINCPMAFDDKGAYWLQSNDDVFNPYFGSEMLKCSDSTELISKGKEER